MDPGDIGLVILLGCAFMLSLLSLWRFGRSWKHAVYVGLASYAVLQVAQAVHLGYLDPFILIGIPIACALCVPVYYLAYLILLFVQRVQNRSQK